MIVFKNSDLDKVVISFHKSFYFMLNRSTQRVTLLFVLTAKRFIEKEDFYSEIISKK